MVGQVLGTVQGVFGPPRKERKTGFGKFLQRITTGSNYQAGQPAPATQNRPLASGTINFGGEQRNRNLLTIVGLVVLAFLGSKYFGGGKKKRR